MSAITGATSCRAASTTVPASPPPPSRPKSGSRATSPIRDASQERSTARIVSDGMILIPILGDQCSHGLAALRDVARKEAVVLMMEVAEETTYVKHHKVKIALILSVMRHFAAELEADGWTVDYVRLDQHGNSGSFTGEVERA